MPDGLAIIFLAALGASVGSFLNVVIYRIPRGQSIIHPGSRCPGCGRSIGWYDNIPVVSYLLLRGRCRACRTPISPRYALVETITAVIFVALYDAFFKAGTHGWFAATVLDWPIFAAYLVVAAVMIACAAIDLEYYLIDIRITYVAMAVGLAAWGLWPRLGMMEPALLADWKIGGYGGLFLAAIGVIARHLWLARRSSPEPEESQPPPDEPAGSAPAAETGPGWPWVLGLIVFVIGAAGLIVGAMVGSRYFADFKLRGFLYLTWAFLAILAGAIPRREADRQIVEVIEQEKSSARATALRELVELLPVVSGFVLGFLLFGSVPALREFGQVAIGFPVGPFRPAMGLGIALTGLLSAAAFGWLVRIVFTLAFGKEAMGVGDIYMLAAIGAVAGPLVAIVGFFIGSVIGVVGIVALLLWKTSRALSYGPWIAIGTLACALFYDPIVRYLSPMRIVIQQWYSGN